MGGCHVTPLECSLEAVPKHPQTSIPGGDHCSQEAGKQTQSVQQGRLAGWTRNPTQLQSVGELCFLEAPLKSLTQDRTQGPCLVRGQGAGGMSSCAGLLRDPDMEEAARSQPHGAERPSPQPPASRLQLPGPSLARSSSIQPQHGDRLQWPRAPISLPGSFDV